MQTLRSGHATALWQELVFEGERRSGLALDADSESYLVFALMRHLGDDALVKRIMALELFAADAEQGRRRQDGLRDVGDRCLLIAGLFPGLAARRRVGDDYFAGLGRSAYRQAAHDVHDAYAGLFARLASAFEQLVRVLRAATLPAHVPVLAQASVCGSQHLH